MSELIELFEKRRGRGRTFVGGAIANAAPLFLLVPVLLAPSAWAGPLTDVDAGDTTSAIESSFTVDDLGHAIYEARFPIPPGAAGMEPALGVKCTSPGRYNAAGRGCQLLGRPYISRCRHVEALDGHHGGLELEEAEGPLCYNGQRLVADTAGEGYRTLIDANVRVVPSSELCEGSPCSFEVRDPDGAVHRYGATPASRLETDSGRPYSWFVSRTTDANGNYVSYQYASAASSGAERLLTQIDYTGGANYAPSRHIKLLYKDASNPPPGRYNDGIFTTYTQILDRVEVLTDRSGASDLLYSYELTHDAEDHLTEIAQCVAQSGGEASCFPAERLTWSSVRPDWDGSPDEFESAKLVDDMPGSATESFEYNGKIIELVYEYHYFPAGDVAHVNDTRSPDEYRDLIRTRRMGSSSVQLLHLRLTNPALFENGDSTNEQSRDAVLLDGFADSGAGLDWADDFFPVRASWNTRPELFARFRGEDAQSCILSFEIANGTESTEAAARLCVPNEHEILFGDYDGDGLVDIYDLTDRRIYGDKWPDGVPMSLSDPYWNSSYWAENHPIDPDTVYLTGDFNGDGKTDLLHIGKRGSGYGPLYGRRAYLADRDGTFKVADVGRFVSETGGFLSHLVVLNVLARPGRAVVKPGDFNGDGLTDFYIQHAGESWASYDMLHHKKAHLLLSRGGSNFELRLARSGGVDLWLSADHWDINTADFNGDGITDLLVNEGEDPNGQDRQGIYLGQADGSFAERIAGILDAPDIQNFVAADFDGDGSVDVFTQGEAQDVARLHRFNGRSTSFLTAVTTGRNRSFSVDYVKFTDRSFAGESADPTADLDDYTAIVRPGYVVDSYTEDYGNASQFTQTVRLGYGRLIANKTFLNPATFDVVRRTTVRGDVEHVDSTWFAYTFPEAGRVSNEVSYVVDAAGNTTDVRDASYTYAYVDNRVLLTSLQELQSVEGVRTTTDYRYDEYGNAVRETVTLSDVSGSQESSRTTSTRRTFMNRVSGGQWRLGLVAETYVEAGSERREWRRFSYDDRHNPILVEQAMSDGTWIETAYEYSERGLVEQRIDPSGLVTDITFDDEGAYPTSIELADSDGNSVALRETVTDPIHGAVVSSVDQAGLITVHERDVFGRLVATSVTGPDGAMVEVARFSSRVEGQGLVTTESRRLDATSDVVVQTQTVHNLRGEVLSQIETSFAGGVQQSGVKYHQLNEFDSAGRISKRIVPARDAQQFVSIEYDVLGRVVKETFAPGEGEGFVKAYTYGLQNHRQTAVSQAEHAGDQRERRCTVSERNVLGSIKRVKHVDLGDNGGVGCAAYVDTGASGGAAVTQYEYSDFGELVKVTDPDGVETTVQYNIGGRKTFTVFAGGAQTSFHYDDAGRLSHRSEADGRTTSFIYDGAGRLAEEVRAQEGEPGSTRVTYEYAGPHLRAPTTVRFEREGDGQVSPISDYLVSYDIYGRATQKVHRIHHAGAGESDAEFTDYVVNYGRDISGRVTSLTYPDGSTQTIERDAHQRVVGYAVADQSASDATLKDVVSMEDFDGFDQPQRVAFHKNGAFSRLNHVRDYSSDGLLRREEVLTRDDAVSAFSATRGLTYSWDLHQIEHLDGLDGTRESFTYDGFGRLTKATGAYGARVYAYSKGGRLLRKAHLTHDDSAYDVAKAATELNDCDAVPGLVGELAFEAPIGHHMASRGTYRYCAQGGAVDLEYAAAFDSAGNQTAVSKPAFLPRERQAITDDASGLALGDLYKDFAYVFDHENRLVAIKAAPKDGATDLRVVARFGYDFAGNRILSEQLGGPAGAEVVRRVIRPTPDYEIVQAGGVERHTKYIVHGHDVIASTTAPGEVVTLRTPDTALASGSLDSGAGNHGRGALAWIRDVVTPQVAFALLMAFMLWTMVISARRWKGLAHRFRAVVATGTAWCTLFALNACSPNQAPVDVQSESRAVQGASAGAWYFHIRNQVGSAVGIYDEDGTQISSAVFTPFGEVYESTGYGDATSPHVPQFANKDSVPATALYYFNARYYDAVVGRFISADDRPGAQSPHMLGAWNPYSYALNNPVIYNDPSGHVGLLAILIGVLVGGVIGGTVAAISAYQAGQRGASLAAAVLMGFVLGAIVGGVAAVAAPALAAAAPSYPVAAYAFAGAVFGAAEGAAAEFAGQTFDDERGYDLRRIGVAAGIGAGVGALAGGAGAAVARKLAPRVAAVDPDDALDDFLVFDNPRNLRDPRLPPTLRVRQPTIVRQRPIAEEPDLRFLDDLGGEGRDIIVHPDLVVAHSQALLVDDNIRALARGAEGDMVLRLFRDAGF